MRIFLRAVERMAALAALPVLIFSRRRRMLLLVWDTRTNPITFDFVWTLVAAEIHRRAARLEGIDLYLIAPQRPRARGESEDYNRIFNPDALRWRIANILEAVAHLLPSIRVREIHPDRKAAIFASLFGYLHAHPENTSRILPIQYESRHAVFAAGDGGVDTHVLIAPAAAREYVDAWLVARNPDDRRTIVVTLRQSPYMPDRNSNVAAARNFAAWAIENGYFVVFVPDTDLVARALPEALSPGVFFPEASVDVRLRLAIYERAYVNIGVNAGPMILAYFGDCALLQVKLVTPTVPQASTETLTRHGFSVGQQPSFFAPDQRLFWDMDDGIEELKSALSSMSDTLAAAWDARRARLAATKGAEKQS